jgi:hypothetical protein
MATSSSSHSSSEYIEAYSIAALVQISLNTGSALFLNLYSSKTFLFL